ncbi:cell envelope integrity protein TolA [bacterium]|nr:cell envelope integrity protein TolA [bacterium]
MRRELIISYASHILLILIFIFVSAFSKPKEPPTKVYSVRILAAPQPEVIKTPETKPQNDPEPAPKEVIEAKPIPKTKPKTTTKPKPKPKQTEQPVAKPKETSLSGEGHITVDGAFNDDFYLNLIYMKVYRNWVPPATSAQLKTTIYFRILKNGEIEGAKVEKRSGMSSYDQQSLRTVLSSVPFPELPTDYTGDHLGIHFEFAHNF